MLDGTEGDNVVPIRPAGMVTRPTGKTVVSEWNAAPDDGARRQLLSEFGITVRVRPEGHSPRWQPLVNGEDPDAGADKAFRAMASRAVASAS